MKKSAIAITLALTTAIQIAPAHAKSASTEENVGFASGAVTGALVGGPVGFFVGAVAGTLLGGQVEKANQLDASKQALALSEAQNQQIKSQLEQANQQLAEVAEHSANTTLAWMTEGLTMDLMFSTASASLSDKDHQTIEKLAHILNQFPDLTLRLDGYADPRGDENYNLKLSEQRTAAVKQVFADLGIAEERLQLKAHGEMLVPNENTLGRDEFAKMRKVSINFDITEPGQAVAQN